MHRGLALLMLALLTLPAANAGTEDDPEIQDARDVPTWTPPDILAVWLNHENNGIRVSIKTQDGSLPERFPGHMYWVSFLADGVMTTVAIGFDGRGRPHTHIGDLNYARGGFDTWANERMTDRAERRGVPSVWSAVIPWGAAPGIKEGGTLVDLEAGSSFYDPNSGRWQPNIDVASSSRVYRALPEAAPPLQAALELALIVALTVAGGILGFIMMRRRAHKKQEAPTTRPDATRPAAPAEPHRIRRDPRDPS